MIYLKTLSLLVREFLLFFLNLLVNYFTMKNLFYLFSEDYSSIKVHGSMIGTLNSKLISLSA